jgi:hypothetical protein
MCHVVSRIGLSAFPHHDAGATGVLQTQLPQRLPAGEFGYSAFTSAAQAAPMDALEMQLACMQGMPGYGGHPPPHGLVVADACLHWSCLKSTSCITHSGQGSAYAISRVCASCA